LYRSFLKCKCLSRDNFLSESADSLRKNPAAHAMQEVEPFEDHVADLHNLHDIIPACN
jgi:hypothetical protein